ncbi:protein kinase domain-containing protein [Actinospica sp.]|jgi:pSer/pThr/pTyr-binding forkhead associated (FHA) protein|uniref:protein kinase domain-containing protein n=1 Tax=Actinospica sp. TaxID=1872142 RepID=UPI002BE9524C|nr:protein kinase [Actinospica sp.]HWG27904.1 protein kinase [Actinospica sp.]
MGRATVSLALVNGRGESSEFVFDERSTCLIGRGEDCSPRLPNDEHHRSVSRHHCMLDINPPDVRIRDFGSRNGTFVNGAKIGQRDPGQSAAQGRGLGTQERDLKDGDEVRLGRSVAFRVNVAVPPEEATTLVVSPEQAATLPPPGCVKCGREITQELGRRGAAAGRYVCAACQANPQDVMTLLVKLAQAGTRSDLRAIAEYDLLGELGRGGMGAVYLARHRESGRLVALKLMLPRVAANEVARARFRREVELTRRLRHPNIAALYEDGFADGAFFFTSEYCEGGSLDKLLQIRGGTLPVDEAVRYALDVLEGLDYAHNETVVHRDLSPSNILLAESTGAGMRGHGGARGSAPYVAKVGDFGLGKAFDQAGLSGLTRTGAKAGKPWYVARQQVVNFKNVPKSVDVWALAACLYKCLTGTYVRDFPGDVDQWHVILYSSPVPIRQRDPHVPRALAEVIDTALIDQQEIGFESAAAFREALRSAWKSL